MVFPGQRIEEGDVSTRPVRFHLLVLSVFATVLLLHDLPVHGEELYLGTEERGSFSFFMGRNLCRAVNESGGGLTCRVAPVSGHTDMLTNLQSGSLDLALVDSLMLYDAINATGLFAFLDLSYDNLRTLSPLYDVPITVIARSGEGITSLGSLRNKWLNVGVVRSQVRRAADMIMAAKQWTRGDFSLLAELPPSLSQDTMAFSLGSIQAMVHRGVHPDATLQRLFRLVKADFVNLEDEDLIAYAERHPAVTLVSLPAGIYADSQPALKTIATQVNLMTTAVLDKETAYLVIKAIAGHEQRLQKCHASCATLSVHLPPEEHLQVPMHPGAAAFFQE